MVLSTQVKRVYNRTLRELSKLSIVERRAAAAYDLAIQRYADQLPTLAAVDQRVIERLEQEGIFITTLSALKLRQTDAMLQAVNCILPTLSTLSACKPGEFLIKASGEQLLQHPDLWLWGLEERLLNLVERYLKLPCAYHGVYFRKDLANGVVVRTRQWHIDKEDRRMLKIIVYLNDVDETGGCFQYVSGDFTAAIIHKLRYNYGKVTDRMMERVVPASEWFSCVGSAGTVIIFDPARVFHRGKLPTRSDRYTLFFDYTSRVPQRPYYCKSSLTSQELLLLKSKLSQRQADCVFWRSKLTKKI